MWTCPKCGEQVDDLFRSCPECATASGEPPMPSDPSSAPITAARPSPPSEVKFQVFRGGALRSWEELFANAAEFASQLGRERLINISHAADHSQGIVTVWYWNR